MDWKQIEAVNKELDTVELKDKAYVMVNKRVLAFRKICPMGSIVTDILSNEDGVVLMKTTISDENGKVLGTGMAYEREASSFINRTSYIENCETSAVGRALAMLGIGVDASMCSAEELANAVNNQGKKDKPVKADQTKVDILLKKAADAGVSEEKLLEVARLSGLNELTVEKWTELMALLDKQIKNKKKETK